MPDPKYGLMGRQRSVHNTYFTLPVLFTMISNHYAGLYGHQWNWVLLLLISVAGALVRVWFVQRHKGNQNPLVLAVGPGDAGADRARVAAAPRPSISARRPPSPRSSRSSRRAASPAMPPSRRRKVSPPRPRA